MATLPVLYTSPGSHHSRRVHLLIHELNIEVESKIIDVRPPGMGGENETTTFLALNPNGKVPVLVHGSTLLAESNAIMAYLCELHGPTPLWPGEPAQRAAVLMWQFWQAAQLSPAADGLMGENMMKPMFGQEPDAERSQELAAQFHRWAKVLDQALTSSDYLVANQLTCADLSIVSALMYSHAAQLPIAGYEQLSSWIERMHKRRSWQETNPPPLPIG